jgi:hypothetical protein
MSASDKGAATAAPATQPYELRLQNGQRVHWDGSSGEDAARRYVDSLAVAGRWSEDHAVIAWRVDRRPQIRIGGLE